MTIHDLVYDEVVPVIQKANSPGMAMRDWLIAENFDPKDVIEVCVALAISYKNIFERLEGMKRGL